MKTKKKNTDGKSRDHCNSLLTYIFKKKKNKLHKELLCLLISLQQREKSIVLWDPFKRMIYLYMLNSVNLTTYNKIPINTFSLYLYAECAF